MVSAYSPSIIPCPPDWPQTVHVSGYLFLDTAEYQNPSSELSVFIESGDPPIYIGFGSMGGKNPERLAKISIEALKKSGCRGILATGWGGLRPETVSKDIFLLDAAPHSWLFPRMAAVVHHGGAGTTAEGLRAGVPSIIVPFLFDQSFWGARIRRMGVGPNPIPKKRLTVNRLAEAIRLATTDSGMRERARACGEAVIAENGLASAVSIVKRYLGGPEKSSIREK
jgi:UDP:flavonoid glycosyltransferase YjiC (YdhE family)